MRFIFLMCILLTSISAQAESVFKNESELAYLSTGGNSEVSTVNAKTTNWFNEASQQTRFGGHYIYGESNTGVSARNWDVNGRYEIELAPRFYLLMGEVIEGNRFVGIKTRYNSDLGLKYYFIQNDLKLFFSEAGYRYAIEDRDSPEPNTYDNKGRLYTEYSQKTSETVQYRLWLEYVPNFTMGSDYLINGEASVTSILSSTFSLKVAYNGMYDNLPASSSFKSYDYAFSTSIVAKF